ncbi:Ig-like domain-containing protein [Candidatus Poribacteria bacterium]|nr:Ig-like domain-containing protein [Candidatus Poribacteria bacterium]
MGKKPVAILVIKGACWGLLLTLWLSGCGEGEKDTYIVPQITVLFPEAGLPSNSGLLMHVNFPPKSIFISAGDIQGTYIWRQRDERNRSLFWKPLKELPQGPIVVSITAFDNKGNRYDVGAHIPGEPIIFGFPGRIRVIDPDKSPPVLVGTQPSQGTVNVSPVNLVFQFVFSEPILTYEASVKLEPSFQGTLLLGHSVSLTSEEPFKTAFVQLKLGSTLSPNTQYTLIVEGVQDYAGNQAEEVRLEFTTGSAQK